MHRPRVNTRLSAVINDSQWLHRHHGLYEAAFFMILQRVQLRLIVRVLMPQARRRPLPGPQQRR